MEIEREPIADKVIFTRRTLPNGKLHWHDSIELCHMISGNAKFAVGNQTHPFSSGDIVTVQSRELHLFQPQKRCFLNISMIPVRELTYWTNALPMLPAHITHEQILSFPGLEKQISDLFDQMSAESLSRESYYNERLILLSLSLWCLLARHFRSNATITNKHRQLLQPILDSIANDCSQEYSLNSLSKQLNYTPEYLSNIFKECIGMGFKEYVDSQRINEAKRLMLISSDSILVIAQKCGFENIRTFNNRFKALVKMTPSEFIRLYR